MVAVQNTTRKLKAILSADVKGYSLLMSEDEAHTIKTLKEYRTIMSEIIQYHSGRVVDNPGDNILAEFSSAVNAVECAVKIQKELKKGNDRFVEDRRMEFRIGVNIGDVVEDEDSIYGSGVNIAARIEGIAEPGGICISRNTYDHVKGKLKLGFEFLGEHEVKNIKEPVRVYKILLDSDQTEPLVKKSLELPDKPSIAVLPFDNMSGDPSQEYFSDGLTEQIINGLCKISDLFVIARNSSFAYRGKSVNIKQIAQELGVRYILEGSVQKAGDRVRITAQLIDATTDYHMWSKHYDRNLSDIFVLQDEITMQLMSAMMINLTEGKQARLWGSLKTSSFEAYDKCVKGIDCLLRVTKKENKQAQLFLKESIDLDNSWAWSYTMLGFSYINDMMNGWSDSLLESFGEAEKNAEKALSLSDSFDMTHVIISLIHLIKRQHNKAIEEAEQAIDLNPNGAEAHANLGAILCYSGKIKSAIKMLKRAFRLNPIPPAHFYLYLAVAYRQNGDYTESIEQAKKSLNGLSDMVFPYLTLILSYSSLNRSKEADKAVEEVLRIDPNFSLKYYATLLLYKHQETVDEIIDNLRKAGLPE